MAEEQERARIPADQTTMEFAVRADERERVLSELADDQQRRQEDADERDRAVIALLIGGTLAAALLLPAWAAIIGAAVLVFRKIAGL